MRPLIGRFGTLAFGLWADQRFQIAGVIRQDFNALFRDQYRIGMPESAKPPHIKPRFDGDDHAGTDRRVIAPVEERRLMAEEPDAVPRVMADIFGKPFLRKIVLHGFIDGRKGNAGFNRGEGDLLRLVHVAEKFFLLLGNRFDEHGSFQFADVAEDAGAGAGHQRVPFGKNNILRDRMREGGFGPDLPAEGGDDRGPMGFVVSSKRFDHRQGCFHGRPVGDFHFAQAGLRIILQQAMGHIRPAAGFPDQPDLIFGFDITHFFDDPF